MIDVSLTDEECDEYELDLLRSATEKLKSEERTKLTDAVAKLKSFKENGPPGADISCVLKEMMGWECPTKSMLRETSAGKVINSSWLRNHLDEEVQELCKNLVAKWKEACGFDIKDKAVKATAEKPTEIQKEKEKGKAM